MSTDTAEAFNRLLLELVPADGSPIGNQSLRERFAAAAEVAGRPASDRDFDVLRDRLIADGVLGRGKGRGGSVHRLGPTDAFDLAPKEPQPTTPPTRPRTRPAAPPTPPARAGSDDVQVLSYRHTDRRKNNPEVGMVSPASDPEQPRTLWQHDPYLDPTCSGRARRSACASRWTPSACTSTSAWTR